jgi:Mn2+/Fe2+ NRAMP family transporter
LFWRLLRSVGLLGLLLLANLFKYPFLLIGSRFTAVTGRSLLEGYQHQSPWFLPLYLLITLSTGVANIAAVSSLAGSLATALMPGTPQALALLALSLCLVVLLLGKYPSLDRLSKAVVALLVLCTLVAAVATLIRGPAAGFAVMFTPSPWTWGSLPFLVALLGWMPCPLDLSAWTSLWIYAREQDSGHKSSRSEVEADFNIGYAATVLMAVLFLVLGAWVMHGTGTEFSQAGAAFSQQLIELYTVSLGAWAYPLIALAALMTMFSTVLTCLDGYPRSASASVRLLQGHSGMAVLNNNNQRLWMLLHFGLASAVLVWWAGSMGALVTLAMWVSFVTTPVLAVMNWRVMQSRQVAPQDRLGPAMRCWAAISIGVLTLFVVLFGISLV